MKQFSLFDSHCDTPIELWKRKQDLNDTDCCISSSQMREVEEYGQFFAFCTLFSGVPQLDCEQVLQMSYEYFLQQLSQNSSDMMLCKKGSDYHIATAQKKCAAFLALEGAEAIGCDPGKLDDLRAKGFGMINLTWNKNNALAGCAVLDGDGLTKQGKEFVRMAQSLGMLIDVSHVSDRAFWDIMDITQMPVVASHSNSRKLCEHRRNLTDEQFRTICDCGGYIGVNLYVPFLTKSPTADFEDVYRHLDHFLTISGGGNVGLGGDLDGCDLLPDELKCLREYRKFSHYLSHKGYADSTIKNIFSNTIKEVITLCIT